MPQGTQAKNQRLGACVLWLDVRFRAMETMPPEGVGEHRGDAALHVPAPVVRHEGVVAEIARAEAAAHNLADVSYPRQRAVLGENLVTEVRWATKAARMLRTGIRGRRGSRPSVQVRVRLRERLFQHAVRAGLVQMRPSRLGHGHRACTHGGDRCSVATCPHRRTKPPIGYGRSEALQSLFVDFSCSWVVNPEEHEIQKPTSVHVPSVQLRPSPHASVSSHGAPSGSEPDPLQDSSSMAR